MAFQPVPTYQEPVEVDEKTGKHQFSPTWLSWFLTLSQGGLSNTIQHNTTLGLQGGASGQYYHLTAAQLNNIPFRNLLPTSTIALTGSPFTYQNGLTQDVDVTVAGGTVSLIEFDRGGVVYFDVGATGGMFRLSPSDRIRVTYTVAPTMHQVTR